MKKQINLIELTSKYADEEKARELLEKIRWPNGPVCPHCKSTEAYKITPKPGSKTRPGLYKCKECRKQFTVTVNTIFEGSHIPLNKWLIAVHLFCASKKGISAHQIHRMLGITYKSAWFMFHRIRHAVEESSLPIKLSGTVEADETYVGGKGKGKRGRGSEKKTPVFSLVQRNGNVKSQPVKNVRAKTLKKIMLENVEKEASIMTDEFPSYNWVKKEFSEHSTVNHGKKQYVNGDIHVNTAEGFFSLLKRGISGTFHHVSKQHLFRYCNEFDFRYNHRKIDDGNRTTVLLKQIEGKRLTYN